MATLTTREDHVIESEFNSDSMPEYDDDETPSFFQLQFQDGTVINGSESMEDLDAPIPQLGKEDKLIGNIDLEDRDSGRFVLLRVRPINETPDEVEEEEADEEDVLFDIPASVDANTATVTIFIARSREDFDQVLGFIFASIGTIILFVLSGLYFLVRRSLKLGLFPIEEINSQIEQIDPDSQDGRITLSAPPEELTSIIEELNSLLARVDQVVTRERRFTSDVAHELRTPISELRTACEVGSLSTDDAESTQLFFADINDIALQMEQVVSNLLSLSRGDQDGATVLEEEIQLNRFITDCWTRFSELANEKRVELDCRIDKDLAITTDREKLSLIVRNLLENAITYSVPGSRIRCLLEPGNPSVNLIFENRAANLCTEDLRHLFDRFWRKETSRSEANHSGLGLSIVKALS